MSKNNLVPAHFEEETAFLDNETTEKFFAVLAKADWIKPTDNLAVSMLLEEAKRRIQVSEMAENAYDRGDHKQYASYSRLMGNITDRILKIMTELGLTPKSRKSIQALITVTKKANKYESLKLGKM